MMNISGNFETTNRELLCVKSAFKECGIEFEKVEKNSIANDSDVLVTLKNGTIISVEVKEESDKRFEKYGDLGIDFISVFHLKQGSCNWKGAPKKPMLLNKFLNDIDYSKPYKDGKIVYSKADLWMFFVGNPYNFKYCEFFSGQDMISKEMRDYLSNNCCFAVNNKSSDQLSYSDNFNSAVFFINHNDAFLNQYKVDLKMFIKNL